MAVKVTDSPVAVLKKQGFTFRINELNDQLEVNGRPISDVVEAILRHELRKYGFKVNPALDEIITYADRNRYHPIRDYLNGLKYDGGSHIETLASYFTNPDGCFYEWLRKWLIGAVRRVLHPGAQNRVLVLEGPQNKGKSKFVEWLCPDPLKSHFRTGPVDPANKDHKIALFETWIWEIAELGSTTRKADREALKQHLTIEHVAERLPYGKYPVHKPALTSFIGTLNDEGGVLSDPTGNRRFMFCKITDIDWQGYTQAVNVDDIWAEAVMLYLAGESADLSPEQSELAANQNAKYEVEDPLENLVRTHFVITPGGNDFMRSSDMISILLDPSKGNFKGTTDLVSKRLSALMVKLGIERGRDSDKMRGYYGIKQKIVIS